MNLRELERLILTTQIQAIWPGRPVRRVVFLPQEHAALPLGLKTDIVPFRLKDREIRMVANDIWNSRSARAHHVIIGGPGDLIAHIALELDRSSWEEIFTIQRRGGVMAFAKGRLVASIPRPRTVEEILDGHPLFDVDNG